MQHRKQKYITMNLKDALLTIGIENNKNGFLVKNRNAEEMITKIEELLNDSSKMQYFSKNSKNTALKFSKEAISKEWNKFLNNI